ncbi:MAG: serine/threonine-protein kinase [Kofleriaceae bacterium]
MRNETQIGVGSGADLPEAVPASGIDATIAAGSAPPPSGIDATLAPDGQPSRHPPITIRAGGSPDYADLLPIERKHYVVGDEIARGGMGRILAARDRRLGRPVAIKELLVDSYELRLRFEREARITAKLQHPAIVNILEAGTWPTGEAFYVMKLVTGESLDKVIAARTTLDKRLALLPNVIAAVDALAYAHANRVIHRDLKPANVLVGDYGETVVIDWGLAKDLDDASEPEQAGPFRTQAAAAGETVAGAVMGTPAYMPVEQALGEIVDERADVYSLGAMLYHVLAGEPPFTGRTADSILAQVIGDEVVPLDRRIAGVPPDLVTIVNKALAKSAGDRYATAKHLADDLKRFQTGQLVAAHRYSRRELLLRWLRRHRGVVAATAIAIAIGSVLAVIGIQRIREERSVAESNGALAISHRNDSEEILAFLITDLRDKLVKTGQAKVLGDVAQRVTTYYDARAVNLDDVDDVRKRGLALMNLAKASADFGETPRARELYGHAAELTAQGLARHGMVPALADLRFRARVQDALLLEATDPKAARAALDALLAEPMPAVETGDYLTMMAHTTRGRAAMHLGDNPAALADFIAARDASTRYLASDPTDPTRAREAAEAEMFLAEQYEKVTKLDDALAALERGRAICEVALAKHPGHLLVLEEHARILGGMGDIHQAARRLPEATAAYTKYVSEYEQVYANDPSSPTTLRMLGKAFENLAMIEVLSSKLPDAMAHQKRVIAIREQLHQRNPDDVNWTRDLTVGYQRIAYFHQLENDIPKSLEIITRSLALTQSLVARDPRNVVWQRDLAIGNFSIAEILVRQAKPKEALVAFRSAATAFVALAALEPTVPNHKRDLAVIRDRVGTTLSTLNDWDGAAAEMSIGIAELEPVVAANPTVDEYRTPLGTLYRLHATFTANTKAGQLPEVLAWAEKAEAVLEPAYERHPTESPFDLDYAAALSTLADILYANVPARRREALAYDAKSEQIMAAAMKRDPTNADVKMRVVVLRDTGVGKARARGAR